MQANPAVEDAAAGVDLLGRELRAQLAGRPEQASGAPERDEQGYVQDIYENVAQLSSIYDTLWGGGGALYDPQDPLGGNTSYTFSLIVYVMRY